MVDKNFKPHRRKATSSAFGDKARQAISDTLNPSAQQAAEETPATSSGETSIFVNAFDKASLKRWGIIGTAVVALLVIVALAWGFSSGNTQGAASLSPEMQQQLAGLNTVKMRGTSSSSAAQNGEGATDSTPVEYILLDENRMTGSGAGRLSFSAVGDNLMNDNLLALADSWAGEAGDEQYDFSPFYTEVGAYIQSNVDVSFINQETTLGIYQNYGWLGYPSYNTPPSLAQAVADAGWRFVNCNSNHSYDTWSESIENAQRVWSEQKSLLTIGSYTSEEDRAKVRVVECNGLRVAMLSYSYGQNGYEQAELPNDYYAVPYDEARMISEVSRAHEVADAVVVYLHFGTEYSSEASEEQVQLAQVCADNGVDVTLFSHSHVIEPVQWINRASGGQMLCAYGLGDFVSGYEDYPQTVLSGMITFDFVAQEDGSVAVENAVWHPLIEHMEGNTDVVRFVKNYSDEEARNNVLLSNLDDPRQWLVDQTNAIIGDAIAIDL